MMLSTRLYMAVKLSPSRPTPAYVRGTALCGPPIGTIMRALWYGLTSLIIELVVGLLSNYLYDAIQGTIGKKRRHKAESKATQGNAEASSGHPAGSRTRSAETEQSNGREKLLERD